MGIVGPVLMDGVPLTPDEASVSVLDVAVLRGYGVFEAMRAYGGRIFRLGPHLDRLEESAARTGIPLPQRDDLVAWCRNRGAEGDVVVRLVVTGGVDIESPGTNSRVIVFAEEFGGLLESMSLTVRSAPWHADGLGSELTGAKTLSYGPNMAVNRAARLAGFDGPLLVGRTGHVLEGPHFTVGWVVDGVVETPTLDLGILASITRQAMLDVASGEGIETREGTFSLERVLRADEVFAMSTTKDITPVARIDDTEFGIGDVTHRLIAGFRRLVASESS
jgi:branched-subunit amino acid aminotransferase/4-amino-4-deoxychorismate lyase